MVFFIEKCVFIEYTLFFMIISVWKPKYKKSKLSHYEMVDNESLLVKQGTTGYKVIWVCDDPNCRTPNKLHSINAGHLVKDKMCYHIQICRPCQCTGEGNGRYGDKRKWSDFLDKERLDDLKNIFSNKWKGNLNPSNRDDVKIKKNQAIITEDFLKQICNNYNFELLELIKLEGKKSEFKVQCENGHISTKKYSSFTHKQNVWRCGKCYYESMGLNLSEEELKKYENYRKQVRLLTSKIYKKYKNIINPNDLIISRDTYHIDHKYSVVEGFRNNVSVNIISAKENLEVISSNDNLKKGSNCSISLDVLIEQTKYL